MAFLEHVSESLTSVDSTRLGVTNFVHGEIVDYENTLLLCSVRGPEGLIVELAERLDGAPG
jgi:hypothetical protein